MKKPQSQQAPTRRKVTRDTRWRRRETRPSPSPPAALPPAQTYSTAEQPNTGEVVRLIGGPHAGRSGVVVEISPDGTRTVGVELDVGPLANFMRQVITCEACWVSTYDPFALIHAALAPDDRRALFESKGIRDASAFAEGDIVAGVFMRSKHLRWADSFYDAHEEHPDANLIPIAAVALACARGRSAVQWDEVRELVERAASLPTEEEVYGGAVGRHQERASSSNAK